MSEQTLASCVEALEHGMKTLEKSNALVKDLRNSLIAHESYIAAQSQVIRHMAELLSKVSDTLGNSYEWEWLDEVHKVAEDWKAAGKVTQKH